MLGSKRSYSAESNTIQARFQLLRDYSVGKINLGQVIRDDSDQNNTNYAMFPEMIALKTIQFMLVPRGDGAKNIYKNVCQVPKDEALNTIKIKLGSQRRQTGWTTTKINNLCNN